MANIYIYIYISGVKISALTREINFFRLTHICRGGAGVGHPIQNCCLCLFFLEKDCVYLDAERLYDHIKWETFQTRALTSPPRQERVKRVPKRYCARSTRSSNTRTKVPARAVACIISYQTAKETTCMKCPSYAVS